jgi:hypothetical protein
MKPFVAVLPISALCMSLLCIPCQAVNDSLYFLFQRSAYLEQLTLPGSWWANPALIAEIPAKTAMTVNVTPLGNIYTIASAKFAMPVSKVFSVGIGVMGNGISPGGSLQASESGAQYSSSFQFSNPSVQIAAGMKLPWNAAAGVLVDIGAELLPDGYGGQSNFTTAGWGIGIITPKLLNRIAFAFSTMSTGHFWQETYWNYDGKAGLRYISPDSTIMGSLQYTLSFGNDTVSWLYQSQGASYQIVKGIASFKMYSIAGLLLGFSTDLGNFSDNGDLLHVGAELRQSTVYPYFGGYEMGIALTRLHSNLIVHHLWVGYSFRSKKD